VITATVILPPLVSGALPPAEPAEPAEAAEPAEPAEPEIVAESADSMAEPAESVDEPAESMDEFAAESPAELEAEPEPAAESVAELAAEPASVLLAAGAGAGVEVLAAGAPLLHPAIASAVTATAAIVNLRNFIVSPDFPRCCGVDAVGPGGRRMSRGRSARLLPGTYGVNHRELGFG